MIAQKTREALISKTAGIQFSIRCFDEKQKNRLIQIHESCLRLRHLMVIKLDEIKRDCERIEEASRMYLRAISPPQHLSQAEKTNFVLTKAIVKASVKAYRDLAKECRFIYRGFTKPGRPTHWQKRIYIIQIAQWYENVTGRKPGSGTGSIFLRFLRACFHEIAPNDELSDSVIKSAMKRYYSSEGAPIKKAMEEEKRRAIRLDSLNPVPTLKSQPETGKRQWAQIITRGGNTVKGGRTGSKC